MITRTVKGIPDETAWRQSVMCSDSYNSTFTLGSMPGYLYNHAQNAVNNWSSRDSVLHKAKSKKWVDTEPDIFTFNINGYTGTFYIGENGKIYCQSSPDIKIEMDDLWEVIFNSLLVSPLIDKFDGEYSDLGELKIKGFKITTSDGTQYLFGNWGMNIDGCPLFIESSVNFFSELDYGESWNTWLLQKIISSQGYEMTFHYEPELMPHRNRPYPISSFYRTTSFEKETTTTDPKGLFKLFGPIQSYNLSIYNKYDGDIIIAPYLKSIETTTQKLDFSISKTVELRYNFGDIALDLGKQFMYYSKRLHCFSVREILDPYPLTNNIDIFIPRADMYLYDYLNNPLAYNFIDALCDFRPFYMVKNGNIFDTCEGLDFDLFQWFKLDTIALYSKAESKYLRKWNFGYNNKSNERLMLLSLKEIGENGSGNNPYTFEYEDYYGTNKYAGNYKLPPYNSFLLDHWGYYNNNNSQITTFDAPNMKGYYAKRDANASYLYTGQLNKINYPLSGSVEFTYEPNQFSKTIKRDSTNGTFIVQNHSTPVTGGGLRIKQIQYKDGNDVKLEKNYTYSNGIMGHEIKYYWPNYKGRLQSNPNTTYTRERFVSQNLLPLCGGLDYSISYPQVNEIISGLGTIEHYYSNHLSNPDENFINTIDEQKSISSPFSSKDFERGKLLRKITKNTIGTIVKRENFTYSKNVSVTKDYIPAVATKQFTVIDGWAIEGASYKQYIYPYGLTLVIDTLYDSNGNNPIVNKTDYSYNNCNLLSGQSFIRSDGKTQKTKYTYPFEIKEGQDTMVMRKMTANNILSNYIEKVAYYDHNNQVIDGEYRKYAEVHPNLFLPERIDLLKKDNTISYDSLYPFTYSYTPTIIRLEDDNTAFPIPINTSTFVLLAPEKVEIYATTTGSGAIQIIKNNTTVYSKLFSFPKYGEDINLNSGTYFVKLISAAGSSSNATISISKRKPTMSGSPNLQPEIFYKYNNKGNVIEATPAGSQLSTTYLWGYNNQYLIAEIKNLTYNAVMTMLAPFGVTENNIYNIPVATLHGYLRNNAFSFAHVTTYTYKPLVGMLTATDPSGKTVYYEYDNFNRLKCIKDHTGKVIESYNYHYQNQ